MKKPLDQETVAEIAGITTRWLQKLHTAEEGPKRTTSGKYLPAAVGEWLRQRFMREFGIADDGTAYDLDAERARLAKWQADKAEMEVELKAGRMLDRDETLAWISDDYATVKARLIQIPDAVSAALPADIAPRVAADVRTLLYEALAELSAETKLSIE
jgi:phage terminase Nu1 subunit (DNA packaging protein)